jgi:DNA-directed RNA polymerase specialized sigma24 family protein
MSDDAMRDQATAAARQRVLDRRDAMEQVMTLARHLDTPDRDLVRSIYDRGLTAAELARASGQSAPRIRRRLNKVLNRLASPEYRFVLRFGETWPGERKRVGEAIFVMGWTQRDAAKRTGLSLHTVRTEQARIEAMMEAFGQMS